jgi:hypothetical protein
MAFVTVAKTSVLSLQLEGALCHCNYDMSFVTVSKTWIMSL